MRHSVAMYSSAFETAGGMFIFAINFPFVCLQKYFSYKTLYRIKKDNTHFYLIEKMIILSMFFTDHLQTHKLKKLTINLIKSNFFFTMLLKG